MKTTIINIGTKIDLNRLIESRLLIQASSGGGKSYMLRVLAEQVLPHMPVIILDWEGEFASLREKFDIVLAGPDGEVPCDVKSAAMLARSLIELQVSAVIDMSELKMHLRQDYARDFLKALVELPRKSWPSTKGKAVMILVDEAHKLCPQKERSIAGPAVIDLQSLGRKRGLCGVLATQRLSKLDKDAAAECGNVLIGRCSSIDSKKACDELGLPASHQHELTQLAAGEWKGVGSAFEPGLQEFHGAKAKTTHVKSGTKLLTPPAPSAKIKKVLPGLRAIQEKTVQEIKDLVAAKKEIAGLRRQVTVAQKAQPKAEIRTVEKVVGDPIAVKRAVEQRDRIWERWVKKEIHPLLKRMYAVFDHIDHHKPSECGYPLNPTLPTIDVSVPISIVSRKSAKEPVRAGPVHVEPDGSVNRSEMKILGALVWYESVGIDEPARAIVGVMAGYKEGGRFNKLLSGLRTNGLIDYPGNGSICLTETGRGTAPVQDTPATLNALHAAWESKLSPSQWKLISAVIENDSMTPQELADATGYTIGGRFNNLLGSIRTLGLVSRRGPITATELVFPEGLA